MQLNIHAKLSVAAKQLTIAALALIALGNSEATSAATLTTLYTFQGMPDGANPQGLVEDAFGNLYGTTPYGGATGYGSVYKLSPDGTETILYSFSGGADGWFPNGTLIVDNSGNVYGVTGLGGASGNGTVFEVSPDGTETVLHTFAGGTDGSGPSAGLIVDGAGNFYGTTFNGGNTRCQKRGCGVVFELAPNGTEKILHAFKGGKIDGYNPNSSLIMDASGNLYGATERGGGFGCKRHSCGTVFKLAPGGAETILHGFTGKDGLFPGYLVMDAAGNLFGVTGAGGEASCKIDPREGCGTAFEIAQNGTFTELYEFGGTGGSGPSGLFLDKSGTLYGTTVYVGNSLTGSIYSLTPSGSLTTLYSFAGGASGNEPAGSLIEDSQGNLYGTTVYGGANCADNPAGCGTVFEFSQ